MKTALIIVDVQNDFCEGGALAVAGGAAVAAAISDYLRRHAGKYELVVATRDWHAPLPDTNDGHFATDGAPDFRTTWPVHCVADTPGAQYHPHLQLPADTVHVVKGESRQDYSGYQGRVVNDRDGHERLTDLLAAHDITAVDIAGIATDYCVAATATDAAAVPGTVVNVLTDLTAAVAPATRERALAQLVGAGINLKQTSPIKSKGSN